MNPHRFVRTVLSAVTVLCAVTALPARAAEEHGGGAGTVYSKDQYPYAELVKQPLTLSAGLIQLDVPVEANLSKDRFGEPWWIAPSVDLGVSDDLTVGLYHPGHGLCLAGTSNGCRELYDDLGARATLGLFRDPGGQLALRAALFAESFKDSLYDGSVGVAYKRTLGNAALVLEADLDVGLNKRDVRAWNETLTLAAEGQLQLAEGVAVLARIGYAKPLDVNGAVADPGHSIPVGVGVEYEPIAKVDVGAEFTFDNLLGENGTADERSGRVFLRMFF